MAKRTETQSQRLGRWLVATLENRGPNSPPIETAQLRIAHGAGDSTGAARWPVKSPQYYSAEKAEEAAVEWLEAAQEQADGLGENLSVFVALYSKARTTVPEEVSIAWRVETSVPQSDAIVPTEKGIVAMLAKMVQEQHKMTMHTMPMITQNALAFAQLQSDRANQAALREEEVRQRREEALSLVHEREMERIQAANEQRNKEAFLRLLATLWPNLQGAIARRLNGAHQEKKAPGKKKRPDGNNQTASNAEQPTTEQETEHESDEPNPLQIFWARLSSEEQNQLAGAISSSLPMAKMMELASLLGVDPHSISTEPENDA